MGHMDWKRPAKWSRHAQRRSQKRSIPPGFVELVLEYGAEHRAGGGCTRHALNKRGWRQIEARFGPVARHFARLRDIYVVTAADDTIVTAAWRQ